MTTEEDFHNHLDAHPDDHTARMIFADYLQEHDDPRAAGYRALGVQKRHPIHTVWTSNNRGWSYTQGDSNKSVHDYRGETRPNILHNDWSIALGSNHVSASRRELEDGAAVAFSKLPPERQHELLNPPASPEQMKRMARARRISMG